jgi:hypothetical protein
VDVDMMPNNHLPPGWKSENGFLVLGEVQDERRLDGNFLTKMHKTSRNKEFTPTEHNCPVPLHFLTKQRMTKMTSGKLVRDKWTRSTTPCKSLSHREWTGYTRFNLLHPGGRTPRTSFRTRAMVLSPYTSRRTRAMLKSVSAHYPFRTDWLFEKHSRKSRSLSSSTTCGSSMRSQVFHKIEFFVPSSS